MCVLSLNLSLGLVLLCSFFVVAFFLCFLDGFSPRAAPVTRNVVKVSFSFSRVVVVLLAHALYLRAQTDRHARGEREREFLAAEEEFSRERRDERDEMKKNETFCVGGVVYVE